MRVVGKTIIERRRNQRTNLPPVTLVVDGRNYVTTEWTLGGFLLNAYADSHVVGDALTVQIKIDAGDGHVFGHSAEAQVVRIDRGRRQLGARFVELDTGTVETLEGWLTGRLRRRAARKKKPA